MNAPSCPHCSGRGLLLGALGNLRWFRCRDCGIDFNTASRRRRPAAMSARRVFASPRAAIDYYTSGAVARGEARAITATEPDF